MFEFVFMLLWVILSWSLFSFVALAELLRDWVMVGLLMFSSDTVTLVLGDPMVEILVLHQVCWEDTQTNPTPNPARGVGPRLEYSFKKEGTYHGRDCRYKESPVEPECQSIWSSSSEDQLLILTFIFSGFRGISQFVFFAVIQTRSDDSLQFIQRLCQQFLGWADWTDSPHLHWRSPQLGIHLCDWRDWRVFFLSEDLHTTYNWEK